MPSSFIEKTVEDIIFENKDIIHNYGLPKMKSITFRQVVLPSGKKLDILSYDLINGHIHIDIYELKRRNINLDAIAQAYNYYLEFEALVAGKFKSWHIQIIMVGESYEPVNIFEKMNLPFSVYTYNYQLTGMYFTCKQNRKQMYIPNDNFSFALWAFGLKTISFRDQQPSTVNLATIGEIQKTTNKGLYFFIESEKAKILDKEKIKEVIKIKEVEKIVEVRPKSVETIVFPEQPKWSKEFENQIPHFDLMDDIEYELDWDDEPEYDNDSSDFEPNENYAQMI